MVCSCRCDEKACIPHEYKVVVVSRLSIGFIFSRSRCSSASGVDERRCANSDTQLLRSCDGYIVCGVFFFLMAVGEIICSLSLERSHSARLRNVFVDNIHTHSVAIVRYSGKIGGLRTLL